MNISKLIKANKEIAQLKALLDLSEAKHDRLVDVNARLMAQVELFRNEWYYFMSQYGCECGHQSCSKCEDTDYGVKLLYKTPRQCLESVKADAARAGFLEGFSKSGEGFNDEFGCEPIELKTMADIYENKIREAKS